MKITKIKNTIGWIGLIFILIAYFLNSFSFLDKNNLIYQFLNLIGALFIFYDSFKNKNYPPAVLNLIWGIISLILIIKILFLL